MNVHVSESGGIRNATRTPVVCEYAGIPGTIGSMSEFGIGTAAHIHPGVAASNVRSDSETCGVLPQAEDFSSSPLRFEDGYAFPPTAPCLGEDMNIVERWRIQPKTC